MRQIKFRAWHKERRYWLLLTGIEFFPSGNISAVFDDGEPICEEDVILEQFTGLKDKNGKEVFEGDILGWDDLVPIAVTFHDGEFSQRSVGPFCSLYDYIDNHSSSEEPSIIGNIHENPELLK